MVGNEVSKEDAAAYLRSQGLKADVSNGVVVAYMPLQDALKPKAMDKLRQSMEEYVAEMLRRKEQNADST